MITITKLGNGIDPASLPADLFVRTVDEYPACYQRITTAIYSNADLEVVVLLPKVSSWLKNPCRKIWFRAGHLSGDRCT